MNDYFINGISDITFYICSYVAIFINVNYIPLIILGCIYWLTIKKFYNSYREI